MSATTDTEATALSEETYQPESPFQQEAHATGAESTRATATIGFESWAESLDPFSEVAGGLGVGAEDEAFAEEIFEALHDEAFDAALAELVNETAEAVDQRLVGETPTGLLSERLQLGQGHLAPVAFEAEQYLDRLSAGVSNIDIASLSEAELDEVLDRFEVGAADVSPAGEEFVRGVARKARRALKAAAKVAAKVALPLHGPVLKRLRSLIRPLLNRVLAMAINRLPAQFRQPARLLARRFGVAEAEAGDAFHTTTPVATGDPEALAESFDSALAETLVGGPEPIEQGESFGYEYEDDRAESESPLENLAQARDGLVETLNAANDGEDMAPAIEQFVPAVLAVLRLGIRLVGRPRVVALLAGYLAALIKQWVGPNLARPLSTAIVDTGLRLASLEQAEPAEAEHPTGSMVLATTIEDTVRRLSEEEDHVFEDEDLLQLAVSDAFEQSVATNFPAEHVRAELQTAPTLAGSFVPRFARQVFAYKKYSRVPEVEITQTVAQSLRSFGSVTLAASLRAHGHTLPMRVRVHIYESTIGTTLPRLARMERVPGLGSSKAAAFNQLHPLTPQVAGVLLREPRLGAAKPAFFLRSRYRIAVGQRFYYLEPMQGAPSVAGPALRPAPMLAAGPGTTDASRGALALDLRRSEALVTMFFSEPDAQAIASAMNRTTSSPALLKALLSAYQEASGALVRPEGDVRILKELIGGEEELGPPKARLAPIVRQRLGHQLDEWVRPMLAKWARASGQGFARAAQDRAVGVTVIVRLRAVPGLNAVRQVIDGRASAETMRAVQSGQAFRGLPNGQISVTGGPPPR